ncbi:unnamed protein product [Camellia sinensis]
MELKYRFEIRKTESEGMDIISRDKKGVLPSPYDMTKVFTGSGSCDGCGSRVTMGGGVAIVHCDDGGLWDRSCDGDDFVEVRSGG